MEKYIIALVFLLISKSTYSQKFSYSLTFKIDTIYIPPKFDTSICMVFHSDFGGYKYSGPNVRAESCRVIKYYDNGFVFTKIITMIGRELKLSDILFIKPL